MSKNSSLISAPSFMLLSTPLHLCVSALKIIPSFLIPSSLCLCASVVQISDRLRFRLRWNQFDPA